MDIVIDKEFAALGTALTAEERNLLEADIDAHGCLDSLKVWQGQNILLDGHNRYGICKDLDKPYKVEALHFPNREAAIDWVCDFQLGRRNLTDEQRAYYRGKRYRNEKKKPSRPEKGGQNDHLNSGKTAERLGEKYGKSAVTIRRDARFADSIDAIGEVSAEIKTAVLTGKSPATKEAVMRISELPQEERATAVRALMEPPPRKERPEPEPVDGVSLTKAEEESRRIIAEFHGRLEKVSSGIYTLESLAIAIDCHQKGGVEFVRMCEVSPHVEVVRTYGRKGLTQYQFLQTNCVSAADRIRQLAERIAMDPSGNSRVHADATRILQLLGG